MQTRLLIAGLASMLIACGGSDGADGTTPADDDTTDTGDEATGSGDGESEVGDSEPEAADDGSSCLPVSRCRSFANQACALVDADGAVQGEEFSAGRVLEACPGARGVSSGVTECFNYVEMSAGCGRNLPDVNEPAWPCGRGDDGSCSVQM